MLEPDHKAASRSPQEALLGWFETPLGKDLLLRERVFYQTMLGALFGYQLVQIGPLGLEQSHWDSSPIKRRALVVDASLPGRASLLMARPEALPLASDSVDVLLLPHALDFCADPKAVLREAERVLIPEGRVLISGFNPWSLWGLAGLIAGLGQHPQPPWNAGFLSQSRLRDWLSLLGFDVEHTDSMLFHLPVNRAGYLRRLGQIESIGRRFWPACGAVYALQAIKCVSVLTPLRPKWQRQSRLLGGAHAVEPTTREARHG